MRPTVALDCGGPFLALCVEGGAIGLAGEEGWEMVVAGESVGAIGVG